ncbi:hypothetical protein DKX38_005077 [Salix brachista]|uniref:Pentacotripeptide-repeat region of PRORP domain-containing protein n=1 Tax=Salix brachista TaxID=2182728 RepID=A0A5N5NED4_9ROSI|nr:hypothetical protein DKX38_005077 [Salix brachista]
MVAADSFLVFIMWSLRRASAYSRRINRSWLGCFRARTAELDRVCHFANDRAGTCTLENVIFGRYNLSNELNHKPAIGSKQYVGSCGYCSKADMGNDNENDEIGGGIKEFETSGMDEIIEESNADEVDGDVDEESGKKKAALELLNTITETPNIVDFFSKFTEEGNELSRGDIYLITDHLRKKQLYWKALQFSEWLERSKQTDFTERDYACHLDCIAKTLGLWKAEKFIDKIPESFRGKLVYQTLLASCVSVLNIKKAESVFQKMRDLGFPITVDACEQMIIIYKRLEKKKIPNILLMMKDQNIKPSFLTYKLLIDAKCQFNDTTGMEKLVAAMKNEGMELDVFALAVIARHYISMGLKDKADLMLNEIEKRKQKGGGLGARRALLPLYASLGKADEVGRIWKECKADPKQSECIAAIQAWGKLGKVEEAEAVSEMMLQTWKNPTFGYHTSILNVYIDNNLTSKGKDLVEQMGDIGSWAGPLTWDALVRLYIKAGDVEKAHSILLKVARMKRKRPLYTTYIAVMEHYAKRGDIHNTEKLFQSMRELGYTARFKPFEILVDAYINAKTPIYGLRARMKADNLYPKKEFAGKMAVVDCFRKAELSNLID